jgi:hypothetical protein
VEACCAGSVFRIRFKKINTFEQLNFWREILSMKVSVSENIDDVTVSFMQRLSVLRNVSSACSSAHFHWGCTESLLCHFGAQLALPDRDSFNFSMSKESLRGLRTSQPLEFRLSPAWKGFTSTLNKCKLSSTQPPFDAASFENQRERVQEKISRTEPTGFVLASEAIVQYHEVKF